MKQGRVVVVTGASGGMGTVFVDRFLANGDTVIAADSDADGLDRLAKAKSADDRLLTLATDVSQEADCGRLADLARERAGRVDVLVNAAGHFPIKPFEEMSLEEWRRIIDINLTGAFVLTRALLPLIKGRGWGRIVYIGSASIYEGVPGQAHYVAAKSGVVGLARTLAREVGTYGVTVNIVTPGLTSTPPVVANFPAEFREKEAASRALGREEQAEDLVGAVFFLASPDANFITGQMLNVDGGKTTY